MILKIYALKYAGLKSNMDFLQCRNCRFLTTDDVNIHRCTHKSHEIEIRKIPLCYEYSYINGSTYRGSIPRHQRTYSRVMV